MSVRKVPDRVLDKTECMHKEICKKRPKCHIQGEYKFKDSMDCPARDFERDSFGINKAFRLI